MGHHSRDGHLHGAVPGVSAGDSSAVQQVPHSRGHQRELERPRLICTHEHLRRRSPRNGGYRRRCLAGFGPKRLPELGRTLGKTLKGFQSASKEFEREVNKAMADPEVSGEAAKPVEELPPSD